ncbi:MAG: hypothetical protein AB1714_24130 [Acidobacteriota bacterium]
MSNLVPTDHPILVMPAQHVGRDAPGAGAEASSPTAHRQPAGFSLLEAIVVLCLVVLCLAISFPVLANMRDKYEASSAASTLSLDLLAVRYRALEESASYRFRFDDPSGYSIEKWTRYGWTVRLHRSFDDRVRIQSNNHPVFTHSGSVTNMATVYVSCGQQRFRKVTLSITGRVKVERLR